MCTKFCCCKMDRNAACMQSQHMLKKKKGGGNKKAQQKLLLQGRKLMAVSGDVKTTQCEEWKKNEDCTMAESLENTS